MRYTYKISIRHDLHTSPLLPCPAVSFSAPTLSTSQKRLGVHESYVCFAHRWLILSNDRCTFHVIQEHKAHKQSCADTPLFFQSNFQKHYSIRAYHMLLCWVFINKLQLKLAYVTLKPSEQILIQSVNFCSSYPSLTCRLANCSVAFGTSAAFRIPTSCNSFDTATMCSSGTLTRSQLLGLPGVCRAKVLPIKSLVTLAATSHGFSRWKSVRLLIHAPLLQGVVLLFQKPKPKFWSWPLCVLAALAHPAALLATFLQALPPHYLQGCPSPLASAQARVRASGLATGGVPHFQPLPV